jgi:5-methylcytosine-specific restriction endonuclease McrA
MRQRAKKKSNGYEKYNEKDVIDMYGIICYLCDKEIDITLSRKVGSERWRESLQIDHVIPISKGGPDFLSNVRPTHALCNNLKNDKII